MTLVWLLSQRGHCAVPSGRASLRLQPLPAAPPLAAATRGFADVGPSSLPLPERLPWPLPLPPLPSPLAGRCGGLPSLKLVVAEALRLARVLLSPLLQAAPSPSPFSWVSAASLACDQMYKCLVWFDGRGTAKSAASLVSYLTQKYQRSQAHIAVLLGATDLHGDLQTTTQAANYPSLGPTT